MHEELGDPDLDEYRPRALSERRWVKTLEDAGFGERPPESIGRVVIGDRRITLDRLDVAFVPRRSGSDEGTFLLPLVLTSVSYHGSDREGRATSRDSTL
jgi:hypothetical protein